MTDETATPTPENKSNNSTDVDVNVEESVGIVILGVLFFFVLMALLRSQKRERKLLKELADLQVKLSTRT